MPPLISIIIPVYNHAHTIERCLRSIVAQSYRPVEVIIIDDGSTDNFDEVIKAVIPVKTGIRDYAGADSRWSLPRTELRGGNDIRYDVFTQPNRGAPAARNLGFSKSSGEFVIFWDADTIARPDLLAKMMEALQVNPQASYAYSGFKFGWKIMKPVVFDASRLKQNNYIDGTSLIRRADYPGWDESIKRFQDWDLWLTMLEKNKTGVCVPEILYRKIVGGRKGISAWLPKIFYKLPWASMRVKEYEAAKLIIQKKHLL